METNVVRLLLEGATALADVAVHCSGGFLKGARAHNRDIKVLCDYEHIQVYGCGEEDIRPVVF